MMSLHNVDLVTLPRVQLDSIEITLGVMPNLTASLHTLESFLDPKKVPSFKLTAEFFNVAATSKTSSIREIRLLIQIYTRYINLHGSKVFAGVWFYKDKTKASPFSLYIKSLWKKQGCRASEGEMIEESVKKSQMLSDFVHFLLIKDLELNEDLFRKESILIGFYNIDPDDYQDWEFAIREMLKCACSRIGADDFLTAARWTSTLSRLISLKAIAMQKYVELCFDLISSYPLPIILQFITALDESCHEFSLNFIDHLLKVKGSFSSNGKLVNLTPSLKKLMMVHFGSILKEIVDVGSIEVETGDSRLVYASLLFLYFKFSTIDINDGIVTTETTANAVKRALEDLKERFDEEEVYEGEEPESNTQSKLKSVLSRFENCINSSRLACRNK